MRSQVPFSPQSQYLAGRLVCQRFVLRTNQFLPRGVQRQDNRSGFRAQECHRMFVARPSAVSDPSVDRPAFNFLTISVDDHKLVGEVGHRTYMIGNHGDAFADVGYST